MKKNLYSLILSEGVVNGIDQLASRLGTNRSHLIDEILAEYLDYQTPEKKIYSIFCDMEKLMSDLQFPVSYDRYDNVFSLKRALAYKYRPTLRYEIALFHTDENLRAELRVNYRTQSRELENKLTDFFKVFGTIEQKFMPKVEYSLEEMRWTRTLYLDKNHGVSETANELSRFVKVFDAMLNKYLSNKYSSYEQIVADYENYAY